MSRRVFVVAVGAATLALVVGAAILLAAGPTPSLPPAKQALENAAHAFQYGGTPANKHSDGGQPLVVQDDPVPPAGMLGLVAAPMPAGLFTTTNAWAGWTSPTQFVVVYAGASGDDPQKGLLLIVRQAGSAGHLDSSASTDGQLVSPPAVGGPLQIVGFDGSQLTVRNPGGQVFQFNPVSGLFD